MANKDSIKAAWQALSIAYGKNTDAGKAQAFGASMAEVKDADLPAAVKICLRRHKWFPTLTEWTKCLESAPYRSTLDAIHNGIVAEYAEQKARGVAEDDMDFHSTDTKGVE